MSEYLSNRDPGDESTAIDQTTIANLHDIIRERDREIERRTTARQEALDALHEQREMSVDREQSMVRAMLEALGQDDIDPAATLDDVLPLIAAMADKVIALWPLARAAAAYLALFDAVYDEQIAVNYQQVAGGRSRDVDRRMAARHEQVFALRAALRDTITALPPDLRAALEADHD